MPLGASWTRDPSKPLARPHFVGSLQDTLQGPVRPPALTSTRHRGAGRPRDPAQRPDHGIP